MWRTYVRSWPLLLVALAGCPTPRPVVKAGPPSPQPKVEAFTEAQPVTAVAVDSEHVWVGTPTGLERWKLGARERSKIGAAEGLPGERIDALAAGDDKLWVITDKGAASFEDNAWTLAPESPEALAQGSARAAVADGDSVWVGATSGLFRLEPRGWSTTSLRAPVTKLLTAADGTLWIGTAGKGLAKLAPKATAATFVTEKQGNHVASVRGMTIAPTGELIVVGAARGGDRIAIQVPGDPRFHSFRPSPPLAIRGVARLGADVLIIGDKRVFALAPPVKGARKLTRTGMQLLPMGAGDGEVARRFRVRPVDLRLPDEITTIREDASGLTIGTATTGTLRLNAALERRAYRAGQLTEDAIGLFIACNTKTDCFMATGGRAMWHFDGRTFQSQSIDLNMPEARVLAVVKSPEARVLAIYQGSDERTLHISERRHDHWEQLSELSIETPKGRAILRFARFAPDGLLWLGLAYNDLIALDEDPTPFGVAIVDLSLNAIAYHHQERGVRAPGVLPIPNDVADVAFLGEDEIWLATRAGATVLNGAKVRVFTEEDGLESELLHGVAATEGGMVFVASRAGVGRYDGVAWSFPRPLRVRARALARGPDGRLWMGTDRGIVVYDGRRSELINKRRGLLEDDVENIAVDAYGRVWARTAGALHIIEPPSR